MGKYSIKDLERLSGVKAHTIRIWEKRYGIVTPQRTDTNIRYYSDKDLKLVLNIAILNTHGLKISKIAGLAEEEINIKVAEISSQSMVEDIEIDRLVVSMIEVDEGKFEKILSDCIIRVGFEDTILNIVYPFLEKIGVMWQTGSINPAQEHFISNLVRQKLIVAIDGVTGMANASSKEIVLFLPEGEMHELGLLFDAYLVKKYGHQLTYLGQSVPLNDLLSVCKIKQADCLITSFISPRSESDMKKYLEHLSQQLPEQHIYVMGQQAQQYSMSTPKNITLLQTAIQLKEVLH